MVEGGLLIIPPLFPRLLFNTGNPLRGIVGMLVPFMFYIQKSDLNTAESLSLEFCLR
jgi:hypothetical protein